jgi:hypothetical protein
MRITLIVFSLVAAAAAPAADSPEAWLIPFAAAYQPPVSSFNLALADYGMPAARSRHFGWGLELRSLTGSFLVGPLFFKTWDDVETGSYRLRTDATGIFGEMGMKLAPVSFLTIVPLLGLGGLSQSFGLREKTGDIGFDTLFGNVPANLSLSTGTKLAGMAALELGLIVNSKSGRLGIALRGGYLYSPFTPTWRLANGTAVSAAPKDKLGGLFFSAGLLFMPQAETASGPN